MIYKKYTINKTFKTSFNNRHKNTFTAKDTHMLLLHLLSPYHFQKDILNCNHVEIQKSGKNSTDNLIRMYNLNKNNLTFWRNRSFVKISIKDFSQKLSSMMILIPM